MSASPNNGDAKNKEAAKDTNEKAKLAFDPPPYAPPATTVARATHRHHTNAVIEAGHVRARDEASWIRT